MTLAFTLTDGLAVYSAVLSTIGLVAGAVYAWRRRWRVEVTLSSGCGQSLQKFGDGYHERHWMTLRIRNRSPQEVMIDSWQVTGLRAGSGPIVIENTGLPVKIEPYGIFEMTLWEPSFLFDRRPKRIYAVDARGRKWGLRRRDVEKAIADARNVVQANADREEKPAWVVEALDKMARPAAATSLFGSPSSDADRPPACSPASVPGREN